MNQSPKVVVVSGYGRGHWLAAELISIGCQVTLLDMSHLLGNWAPEDIEGPFGFLNSEKRLQSQIARLEAEDYSEEVASGFCIWLKSGPIHFRGSIANTQFEKRRLLPVANDYLAVCETLTDKEKQNVKKRLMSLPFYENWLANFSHSYASSVVLDSTVAMETGEPLSLLSPYFIRRVSRRGIDKSLNWIAEKGVEVQQKGHIQDLNIEKTGRIKWKNSTGTVQEIVADKIVWALSSEETDRLGEDTCGQLFNVKLEPEFVWIRQRLEIQHERLFETLPSQFVMIEDLALPWTHANVVAAQKTLSPFSLDLWVRIPTIHRFNKKYLDEVSATILMNMKSRLPANSWRWVERSPEYSYDYATLGPARHGQYRAEALKSLKPTRSDLLHFDGPEQWQSLDWAGQFNHQLQIFSKIRNWKNDYDDRFQKYKRKLMELEQKERNRLQEENRV